MVILRCKLLFYAHSHMILQLIQYIFLQPPCVIITRRKKTTSDILKGYYPFEMTREVLRVQRFYMERYGV